MLCSAAQFLTVTRILHVCLSLNDYDDPPPDNDHSRANAPLPTVQAGLKQLIAAGVPPAKLVCGLPWYGYVYKLTKKGKVLVRAPHPRPAGCLRSLTKKLRQDNDQLPFWRIQELLSNASWTSHWDEASQTPYLVDTADEAGWREVWYDNPKSLRLKVAMAKELGVKSFGMWYIQQPQTILSVVPFQRIFCGQDVGRSQLQQTVGF